MTTGNQDRAVSRAIATVACDGDVRFSIATLVTDPEQHDAMIASMRARGFDGADCEFIHLDNRGAGALSAFDGLNRLLEEARGRYVILCHQDVRLIGDGRDRLEEVIAELDARDPAWAVIGNAGGVRPGRLAIRISDPHGRDTARGPFPARATSLDENFLLVRKEARLAFSHDLAGFHLYGADLCTIADILGRSAYVVDFHLEHLSAGNKANGFAEAEASFRRKYRRALRTRWIQTTCTLVPVSGSRFAHWMSGFLARPVAGLLRRSGSAFASAPQPAVLRVGSNLGPSTS
ncbi:MAG: hypothetical protein GC150_00095 [Rhizobiales bacterium]|nr:hypothetical protein [Hyphomicrobiales bacterium]